MNRPQQGFPPILDRRGPPRVRRFDEQRWLIDNIIRANGIDWDQPRSLYIHLPCGTEANADFAGIRERVKKMADIGPAFAAVARRREAKANAAALADHKVTARDNFFMAAVHWGAAQWPYDENDETNIAYNNKKRECYAKYATLADHHVEAVWVPFKDKAIPGWLHLPPGYSGGKLPVVISVPGMDSYKEIQVALYGDKFLNRGMAVLAIDGPGQYEAPIIGLYFSMENWIAAGPALVDLLAGQIDLSVISAVVAGPLVRTGKLKAYAVIGRKRFSGLPDLPTFGELGYKKLDIDFWHMLLARAGTPRPIIDKLNSALRVALADPVVHYDGIWVAGLQADVFPQPVQPNPFLPLAAQRAAGVPTASAEGRIAQARELLSAWRSHAGELVLSAPARTEDLELLPSPLLTPLPPAPLAQTVWLPALMHRDHGTEPFRD